ncbi:hypothetical protein L1887_22754 [Cichorium endivia]|nr:hypothetical protein L1887_22754 [Cichorium endivia]
MSRFRNYVKLNTSRATLAQKAKAYPPSPPLSFSVPARDTIITLYILFHGETTLTSFGLWWLSLSIWHNFFFDPFGF